jgi:hypothetical protein
MKKLSQLTTEEVKAVMSIAGDPDQCTEIMTKIIELLGTAKTKEGAVLINLELVAQKVLADVRLWKKQHEKRTGQKLS